MGLADPLEEWIKNKKSENMQKRAVFYVTLYVESNQGRQV